MLGVTGVGARGSWVKTWNGMVGKDLEAHPVPAPAMGHLPLKNAALSSVQPGLGHFTGTEGIQSQGRAAHRTFWRLMEERKMSRGQTPTVCVELRACRALQRMNTEPSCTDVCLLCRPRKQHALGYQHHGGRNCCSFTDFLVLLSSPPSSCASASSGTSVHCHGNPDRRLKKKGDAGAVPPVSPVCFRAPSLALEPLPCVLLPHSHLSW